MTKDEIGRQDDSVRAIPCLVCEHCRCVIYKNLKKYTYSDGDTSQYEYKYNTSNQLVQERYTYPDGSEDVVNYTYDAERNQFV